MTCRLCDRPTDAPVCTACMAEARRDLGEVACIQGELDLTLTRQVSKSSNGRGAGESPLPFDERASFVASELWSTLRSWVSLVEDELDADQLRSPITAAMMADVLVSNAHMLRHHDAAPDFVTEVREAVADARRAIDRPAPRAYVGRCVTCLVAVYARRGSSTGTCSVCRTQYDVATVRAIELQAVTDQLVTATEASRALTTMDMPVTSSTIRGLANRGRLVVRDRRPAPGTTRSTPLYRMGDVIELVQQRRREPSP